MLDLEGKKKTTPTNENQSYSFQITVSHPTPTRPRLSHLLFLDGVISVLDRHVLFVDVFSRVTFCPDTFNAVYVFRLSFWKSPVKQKKFS